MEREVRDLILTAFVRIVLWGTIAAAAALIGLQLGARAAHAEESFEIMGGALTQHFTDFDGVSQKFDHKVSKDGTLISNPLIGFRDVRYEGIFYNSTMMFGGENSIGEFMLGGGASMGVKVDHVRLGLAAGGYVQDDQKFLDRGITPFSIGVGNGYGVVPLVGVEFNIDAHITNRTYLSLYTIVTPILSSSLLSIGFDL